jgi:hypothetical protein
MAMDVQHGNNHITLGAKEDGVRKDPHRGTPNAWFDHDGVMWAFQDPRQDEPDFLLEAKAKPRAFLLVPERSVENVALRVVADLERFIRGRRAPSSTDPFAPHPRGAPSRHLALRLRHAQRSLRGANPEQGRLLCPT